MEKREAGQELTAADSKHTSLAEIALEREKVQIERERLALERERWSAERDRRDSDIALRNRSSGRVTLAVGTLALALLSAILAGGAAGAWIASTRDRAANSRMAASLIHAFGSSSTNESGEVDSPLLRSVGHSGRGRGYLLILD